jgi:hypothetical protein
LPKWKKDAKEFKVAVHKNEKRGYYTTTIPTPVIEHLGKGKEVEAIRYSIKGKRVEVRADDRTISLGRKGDDEPDGT